VLGAELGLDAAEIEELLAKGVLGQKRVADSARV